MYQELQGRDLIQTLLYQTYWYIVLRILLGAERSEASSYPKGGSYKEPNHNMHRRCIPWLVVEPYGL